MQLLTVIESPLFARDWPDYWTDQEHADFIAYLAGEPTCGDVVPGSGGCRKVRWGRSRIGKRGGVRVIFTAPRPDGAVVALLIYGKGAKDNIPAHVLRQISEEFGHADE